MLSLALPEATGPKTAKKRQWYSGLDSGVDPKKRRREANDKVRKSRSKDAAPAVTSSSLKISETPSAGEQPSEEEAHRGRRRWRAGSEPRGWDDREWYLGDNMVASVEDRPGKHDSKSTTNVSTSAHDSDGEDQPFVFEFFGVSAGESDGVQSSSKFSAATLQSLKVIQHSGI